MHGSLNLSPEERFRFQIIFSIMLVFLLVMLFSAVYVLCSNQIPLRHLSPLNTIIDCRAAKREVAKQSCEPGQDGAAGQAMLAEHGNAREMHTIALDW